MHCVDNHVTGGLPIGKHEQWRVSHPPSLEMCVASLRIRAILPGLREDTKGVTIAPRPGPHIKVIDAILRIGKLITEFETEMQAMRKAFNGRVT